MGPLPQGTYNETLYFVFEHTISLSPLWFSSSSSSKGFESDARIMQRRCIECGTRKKIFAGYAVAEKEEGGPSSLLSPLSLTADCLSEGYRSTNVHPLVGNSFRKEKW
jgi:hypothetical protein